jgi:hypothetical protein
MPFHSATPQVHDSKLQSGTLDAIFSLHHLISAAQHNRQRLFVVFVDHSCK